MPWSLQYRKKEMPAEYAVTFKAVPQFVAKVSFPDAKRAGSERAVTLIKGLTNGPHTVRLTPVAGGPLPILAYRLYHPVRSSE